MITFNQLNKCTADNRYTQKDLIGKIRKIVASKGYDSKVTDSVVNSFVTNGLVEIYDELGYQKWMEMINQVVSHEIAERKI